MVEGLITDSYYEIQREGCEAGVDENRSEKGFQFLEHFRLGCILPSSYPEGF